MNIDKKHLKPMNLNKKINELLGIAKTNFNGFTQVFISKIQSYRGQLVERTFAVRKKGKKIMTQEVLRRYENGETFCRNLRCTLCGYKAIWKDTRSYWLYDESETFYPVNFEPNIWVINDFTLDYVKSLRPDLKYCSWDNKGSFIMFLREYNKCPYIEMLEKLDLKDFIGKETIQNKLNKDKTFRKFLFANAKNIKENFLDAQQVLSMYNHNLTVDEVILNKKIKRVKSEFYFRELKQKNPELNFNKVAKYLVLKEISPSLYEDYIKAVKFLHLDLNQEKNVYPHDFMKYHDLYTEQYECVINKSVDEDIEKIANKYKPILKTIDNITMKFPTKTHDFIQEGKILHHCVGRMGYNKKMAEEQSLIIFIRKKEEIDKPFLTLEYDPKSKKVVQFYGEYDHLPEQKYQDLIYKKWLPSIKKVAI